MRKRVSHCVRFPPAGKSNNSGHDLIQKFLDPSNIQNINHEIIFLKKTIISFDFAEMPVNVNNPLVFEAGNVTDSVRISSR